jgi:HEAT repeat protein
VSPGSTRDAAAASLAGALERARLPVGVVEQVFLLLEDAAPRALRILLDRDDLSHTLRRAALEAIGRLGLRGFDADLTAASVDVDPDIRAAALRALGEVGHLPAEASASLRKGFADSVDFVRIQAARSGWLLGEAASPLLWVALGDRSWWVRRAAGEALLRMGGTGRATLERAGREHHDRYAREMAAQTLRDAVTSEQVGGAA